MHRTIACQIAVLGLTAMEWLAGCGRLGFDAGAPAITRDGAADDATPRCSSLADDDGHVAGAKCDPCPELSSGVASDSDGDGVSDACDPNPGRQDTVWLFANFTVVPPTWPVRGRWSPSGDQATITLRTPAEGTDRESYLTPLLGTESHRFDDFAVTIMFTVEATAGSAQPELGLFVSDSATGMGLDCTLLQNGSAAGARQLGLYDENKDGSPHRTASRSFLWQTGVPYALTLTRHAASADGTHTCSASGADRVTASLVSSVTPRSDHPIDLWVRDMTARIDWMAIVGSP